jgi:chemotaxis protein MotB
MADYNQPIIIKKGKKHRHAHHGGAWKIAYADFVTAMMAFFLMLWLISMTTDEQKKGLADYFAPTSVSTSTSGAGGIMGGNSMDDTGAQRSGSAISVEAEPATSPPSTTTGSQEADIESKDGFAQGVNSQEGSSQPDLKSTYDKNFHAAAASIKQAWQSMPNITDIADNLLIEETKDGLNIQIVDQDGRPMFPEGSKYPFEITRQALAAIAPVLQQLPNQINISGHTAAGATYSNPRYGSWELSSDRANTVRSILGEFGLSADHIHSVIGRSTTDPFFNNDPYMAANERIEITVLYEPPPVPPEMAP